MNLYPKLGVGPLRFGMSESEVRREVGTAPHSKSRRDPVFETWSLYFKAPLLTVEFDENNQCCSIELSHGAKLVYCDQDLSTFTYGALVEFLGSTGLAIKETASGFRCESLCLACYSPDSSDPDIGPSAKIGALMAYRKGYYEDGERKIARAGGWRPS
jgi:hypothetical protein